MSLFERIKKPVFSAEEEQKFLDYYSSENMASARLIGAQILIVFVAAGFIDTILLGELATLMMFMRFSIFSPLLFILLIFSFTRHFKKYMQLVFCLEVAVVSFYIALFTLLNEGEVAMVYFSGSLLVVFIGFIYVPMLFNYALGMSVFLFSMSTLGLLFNRSLSEDVVQSSILLLLTASFMSLAGCYTNERNARLSFRYQSLLNQQNNSLVQSNYHLKNLATIDSLTGLANRRAFDERFKSEWQRAEREQTDLSVLLLDVDFFKPYNDFYGHQQGDICLKQVAQALSESVRRGGDFVARYGGEEFVILLPKTDVVSALSYAEKIRSYVAALKIPHEHSKVVPYVTLSIGVASIIPGNEEGDSMERLLRNADRALYQAKASGRNRVCELKVTQ